MSGERYKPTDVRLDDPAQARPLAKDRPRVVTISLLVLGAAALYMMFNNASSTFRAPAGYARNFLIATFVVSHAVNVLFLAYAFLGRNWARIGALAVIVWNALLVGLSSFSVISMATSRGVELGSLWSYFGWTLGFLLVKAVATAMLFTPTAAAWYRPTPRFAAAPGR